VLTEGKEIKINQIVISQNCIRTDDSQFKIEFDSKFFDVCNDLPELREDINSPDVVYNFNLMYENILKKSALKIFNKRDFSDSGYKQWTETKFKVNGIDIHVTKADGRVGINGIFCRIDDVFEILSKAICYQSKQDFDIYVKDVSHIGISYKKMIGTGITIVLHNPLFRNMGFMSQTKGQIEEMNLRFSLLWDADKRSKVYLYVNGAKYLISNRVKFKKHFFKPHSQQTVQSLKDALEECLESFPDEQIITIVENAAEEAKIVKERGIAFLKDTVNDIGAQETQINVHGEEIKGFLMKGVVTGAMFFVDSRTMSVYKQTNGQWNRRCVVDDPNKNRIFEDRLANRLVNVFNENKNIAQLQN
jgi:hypothetical protein